MPPLEPEKISARKDIALAMTHGMYVILPSFFCQYAKANAEHAPMNINRANTLGPPPRTDKRAISRVSMKNRPNKDNKEQINVKLIKRTFNSFVSRINHIGSRNEINTNHRSMYFCPATTGLKAAESDPQIKNRTILVKTMELTSLNVVEPYSENRTFFRNAVKTHIISATIAKE